MFGKCYLCFCIKIFQNFDTTQQKASYLKKKKKESGKTIFKLIQNHVNYQKS